VQERPPVKRGDFVWIERGDQRVKAMIVVASENGRSLMLMFDAFFRTGSGGGFAGMMPVFKEDDGVYYDIVEHEPVKLVET
jgi:hypothetical protein